MSRKGPKPCLRGSETPDGVVMTLYESVQGALVAVDRWTEPDVASIQESGELVKRLDKVRTLRKSQGK